MAFLLPADLSLKDLLRAFDIQYATDHENAPARNNARPSTTSTTIVTTGAARSPKPIAAITNGQYEGHGLEGTRTEQAGKRAGSVFCLLPACLVSGRLRRQ